MCVVLGRTATGVRVAEGAEAFKLFMAYDKNGKKKGKKGASAARKGGPKG
jgi:hypothetical protein